MADLGRRDLLAGGLGAMALSAPSRGVASPMPRWPQVDAALRPQVDQGQLSGYVTLAYRAGRLVHASSYGQRDLASGAPMKTDGVFRIYSMTKPVVAAAMMILRDQGRWRPEDSIARHLPELAGLKVYRGQGPDGRPILEAPRSPPNLAQLLTHTAGFSYGGGAGYVDELQRAADPYMAASSEDFLKRVASLPLAYEPGTRWRYSIAVDIQGMIVERLTGRRLSAFLADHIFGPLRMPDTDFFVPAAKRGRLVSMYSLRQGRLVPPPTGRLYGWAYTDPPPVDLGGIGLVSTAGDYARFCRMLLGRGQLGGVRILSAAAVDEMLANHLSHAVAAGNFGAGGVQRIRPGYEFGYDGAVVTDPARAGVALGRGSYLWSGAAGTWFWVDPENQVVFVGMIQRESDVPRVMEQVQDISQRAVFAALGKPCAACGR
jgi:CubicO group peptidase (beta-lactamase class C family)